MATTFAEVRPEFTHPNEIIGSLPYLAPEQTGRTARAVDQRADIYGLGATLYELATGEPPFGTGDPLRLSHDHLARVPVAPAMVSHTVPVGLSDVIMHMLEKEPDNRYQTAEGLIHDLVELNDRRDDPNALSQVGTHDYPLRLLPPSRIIGRDTEIATLDAALSAALNGRCHGVIVSGLPGVGKTSLINELRPIVTARNGWFVAGKFDQYRRDQEFDAAWQAMHSLGRLLLAEPEEEVADVRARMLQALGPYAGLLAAVHPSFAALLDVAPDPTTADTGDPLQQQARLQALTVELLRIVVSPERPLVFVIDDLQWAGRTPLGLVDMVINDDNLEGLLLVGAYREDEVDATDPLTPMLSRWTRPGPDPNASGSKTCPRRASRRCSPTCSASMPIMPPSWRTPSRRERKETPTTPLSCSTRCDARACWCQAAGWRWTPPGCAARSVGRRRRICYQSVPTPCRRPPETCLIRWRAWAAGSI